MAVHSNSEDSRILRQLYPLATFPSDAFKELCTNIQVEQVQDALIFKKGDTNTDLVYLLEGSVTLQSEGLIVETITSESESAKFALAHQIPRKIDAVANGRARIIRLDADTVNNPPPAVYREDQGYTIIEELSEDSDDWMTALLRLPLFQTLPPNNLQKILISLKPRNYAQGDEIIGKGSSVNDYYIINKGQCLLSRNLSGETHELKLNAGDCFGEEYLITENPAQEKVTALTDVSLIQLEKKHFLSQIKSPLLDFIEHENMPEALGKGSILLDVRLPQNFESQNLDGSANIPLLSLRFRLSEIPKDRKIIVVCANGKASEAAAFILRKNRFDAQVLTGGLGIEEKDEVPDDAEPADGQNKLTQPDQTEPGCETTDNGLETENKRLSSENTKLTQLNHELEMKIALLKAEKEEAERQCQVLTQQLDRLKDILKRLTRQK